jgi:hypothetical protein
MVKGLHIKGLYNVIRRMRMFGVLLLVFVVAGCASGPNVRSDYDVNTNFAQYSTFAFAQPLGTDKAGYTSLVTERLKTATRLQLEQRGYVLDEKSPDLLVNFLTQVNTQSEYVPPPPMPWGPNYYGYRMGFYGPWAGYQWAPQVIQYTQGVLNIDLIDAELKQLVWEGIATTTIDDLGQASSQAFIDPLVADIFKRYPFLAGSGLAQGPQK